VTAPSAADLFSTAERMVIAQALLDTLDLDPMVQLLDIDEALTIAFTTIVAWRERSAGDRTDLRADARARLHIVQPNTSNGEPA
jgi:hypothetical protein